HDRLDRRRRRRPPGARRRPRPRPGRRPRGASADPGGEGRAGRARDRQRRLGRGPRGCPVRAAREAQGISSRARARPKARRRRSRWPMFVGIAVFVGLIVGAVVVSGTFHKAIDEFTLPLDHEDIIRQQADEKGVDAALIAAVIDTESKFSDAESSAGARGLMQITPEAAQFIEKQSGGTTFKLSDLSNPEINIRYGTFLLKELL